MSPQPHWVGYPDDAPPRFNGGIRCDMLIGPCACGATHEDERVTIEITGCDVDLGSDD